MDKTTARSSETERAAPQLAIGATTSMQVAADIRRRILQGELVSGQRLKIDEIAVLCGVSHMPVRMALQDLEAEGVLEVYPHRGAIIRGVDASYIRNMMNVRAAVEVMLTEHCARAVDKSGLAHLGDLTQEFENAATQHDLEEMIRANFRLHNAINSVANNPEALLVLERGRLLIGAMRMKFGHGQGRIDIVVEEHRSLWRAISRREEKKAGDIARRHCEGARDDLLSLLGGAPIGA